MARLFPVTSVMTTAAAFAALCIGAGVANADGFSQTNLVSNIPGLATVTDPKLINPWGVSFLPGSPIWVSNQGTNTSNLYPVVVVQASPQLCSRSASRPREAQARQGRSPMAAWVLTSGE